MQENIDVEYLKNYYQVKSDKELSDILGVSVDTVRSWKKRGVSKIIKLQFLNNKGNYIHNIKKNEGNINQGGVTIPQKKSEKDPREQTLLDKFRTLSEIGKIEVENCVNNIYLKELKQDHSPT